MDSFKKQNPVGIKVIFNFLKKEATILLFLAAISAVIRLYINFHTEFIPGAVGAFYIAQVRSIILDGHLAYKDFPLIFYSEAAIAKLVLLTGAHDVIKIADYTLRIFDAVVPALSIFPAFYLVKKILAQNYSKASAILFAAISIFYISFFVLVSDYQKNSLGLLWLLFLILYMYKLFTAGGKKNLLIAFVFLALTGITHFGCFSVAVIFLIITALVKYLNEFNKNKIAKLIFIVAAILFAGISTIYFFSPSRVDLLMEASIETFKQPILIELIKGVPVLSSIDIISVVLTNIISFTALYFYLRNKAQRRRNENLFLLSLSITCLILSSPFLWTEWALRLYYISYIFIIPLSAFLYQFYDSSNGSRLFKGILFLILFISITVTVSRKPVSNMNRECFNELKSMKKYFLNDGTTIIISRLGLHYWASLILDKYAVDDMDISRQWWARGNHIYYLAQIKNKAPFGLAGLYGNPFPEPRIPENSKLIFGGKYYQLYLSNNPPNYLIK